MKIRAAVLFFAFAFAALPAQAQGNGGPPPNYQQIANQVAALTAQSAALQAQVTALQGQVSKLEGNIVASDLAGTYNITGLSTTMSAFRPGTPSIPATINTSAFRATLTLNADGTGVTSAFTGEGSTLRLTGAMTGIAGNEPADTVTWTYANGVITITFLSDGDEIPFSVALGGRLLIMAYAPFHPSDPSSDQFLVIATRLR
jgi:hypothetical protein